MATGSSVGSSASVGRPRIDVSEEDILSLSQLNYSWSKIADILGISRNTLYRRLREFDIDPNKYTDISQSDLDEVLKSIKTESPNCGEVMLQGLLLHKGIKVPRAKLRSAIHRVDHTNTVQRQSTVISRRVYTNPHPNAVWHIDGNHKMIRWRLVIHAGVDGFSRCITYIKCANNNSAMTVLDSFMEGMSVYGRPVCVRSDHGGENVEVWKSMLSIYNNPSCIITGSSVHNERIERMWRDVTRCVSNLFIMVFNDLEVQNLLDPMNEVDIFCLHYIFIPRINKSLSDFQGSWNCHPLSTEGNLTPLQLFVEGFIASGQYESAPQSENQEQSMSSNSEDTLPEETESVEVPSNKFIPCHQLFMELQSVNPMSDCTDLGKQFYCACIQIAGQHLQSGCNNCQLQ